MVSKSRVVEILSNVGSEFTLEEVVSKLGISHKTAKKYLRDLLKAGYIAVKNEKYVISEKGYLLLEATRVKNVSASVDQAYVFTDENGAPFILKIDTITKLYVAVKYSLVPENIVKQHLEKGYLTKWISEVLGAKILSENLANIKSIKELIELLEDYLAI